jgi:hypothetical protein
VQVPKSHWQVLAQLDLIKTRNKPIEAPTTQCEFSPVVSILRVIEVTFVCFRSAAPFFLVRELIVALV